MSKQMPTPGAYQTPCSTGNPDDWFIDRQGRQYGDVDIVSDEAFDAYLHEIDPDDLLDAEEKTEKRAEVEAIGVKQALIRRRQARDACHTNCYFRSGCLTRALDEGHTTGTWGGYYEEELRQIRTEKARRNRR